MLVRIIKNQSLLLVTGDKEKEIGKADINDKGQILKPVITETVLGFVVPKVKDSKGGTGGGAVVVVTYQYCRTYQSDRKSYGN